eukprot:788865-Pelagomonas_calceolata.AAC.3
MVFHRNAPFLNAASMCCEDILLSHKLSGMAEVHIWQEHILLHSPILYSVQEMAALPKIEAT